MILSHKFVLPKRFSLFMKSTNEQQAKSREMEENSFTKPPLRNRGGLVIERTPTDMMCKSPLGPQGKAAGMKGPGNHCTAGEEDGIITPALTCVISLHCSVTITCILQNTSISSAVSAILFCTCCCVVIVRFHSARPLGQAESWY